MPQKPLGVIISQPQKKEPIKNQPESSYNIDNGSNNIPSSSVVDDHDHDDDGFSSAGSRILMSAMSRSSSSQEPISRCCKSNKKRKHVQPEQVHQDSSKKRTRKRDHNIITINNDSNYEISTKLSLRDETWPTKEDITQAYTPTEDMRNKMLAYNIGLMKHYRPGEEEHESRIGVSTKLNLFTYPWNITKILTPSDLGHLSRLLVQTRLAERFVMPFLDAASRDEVIWNPAGLRVRVWDCDTNSMHRLVFKKWATSNSYVLVDHWTKDFVRRRELAAGDEIGMCWDSFYSRFNFSVLKRAPRINYCSRRR